MRRNQAGGVKDQSSSSQNLLVNPQTPSEAITYDLGKVFLMEGEAGIIAISRPEPIRPRHISDEKLRFSTHTTIVL
jgi:hypothetical protein